MYICQNTANNNLEGYGARMLFEMDWPLLTELKIGNIHATQLKIKSQTKVYKK